MRIRTIKPEFFLHEALFEAEKETGFPLRVAFAGLWCAADREGRFKWEARRLGVSILPYDGIEFSRVLDALLTRGFLVKYAIGSAVFGAIPTFTKHQVVNNKERASEIPEPSAGKDPHAMPTRDPRVDDACPKEGKGKEGNMEHGSETAPPPRNGPSWFPESLYKSESFRCKWGEWEQHLRDSGKPITSATRSANLVQCERAGEVRAIEVILAAIRSGWKSLVWDFDKGKPNGYVPPKKPAPVYQESDTNRDIRELAEKWEREQKAKQAAEKEKSK